MPMQTRLMFVHALSPLHAGTGKGVGVIDLPIAREKATGIPFLPGSSLKGVLRDSCQDKSEREKVFGPDTVSDEDHASSVQFSDQRLLLLPIRSLKGTFAWVTSPYLLCRFTREGLDTGLTDLPPFIPRPEGEKVAVVAQEGCALTLTPNHGGKTMVVLEDLDLDAAPSEKADAWATWLAGQVFPGQTDWQTMLQERFCVVHDDMLGFLLNTATEITARIRLKEETKTVAKGGLWYEEALPTETVLSGLVAATPTQKSGKTAEEVFRVVETLTNGTTLQLGGKATVGCGLCRVQMVQEQGEKKEG